MTVKGLKLKSESFFSISYGILELWRKTLKGEGGFCPSVWIGLRFSKNLPFPLTKKVDKLKIINYKLKDKLASLMLASHYSGQTFYRLKVQDFTMTSH